MIRKFITSYHNKLCQVVLCHIITDMTCYDMTDTEGRKEARKGEE